MIKFLHVFLIFALSSLGTSKDYDELANSRAATSKSAPTSLQDPSHKNQSCGLDFFDNFRNALSRLFSPATAKELGVTEKALREFDAQGAFGACFS
jgi:hypothetical protein